MASVNKVILVGNLGRDPEMRYTNSGEAIANLAVATTDKYKDKSGQLTSQTEWHRITFFGRTADVCGEYLKKGNQVYIEGALRTRKYTDKDGVERYVTEIRGDRMQMLGGRRDADDAPAPQRNREAPGTAQPPRGGASGFDDLEDDIPF